jgi:TolA-binding protein
MAYTLGQAAEATGKAKSTILKSINAGRISATKDDFGNWQIQPVELHRVYPPLPKETAGEQLEKRERTGEHLQGNAEEQAKIRELQARIEVMQELLDQIKGERDNLRDQNTRLTALLPAPKAAQQPSNSLWWWPFRRES